MEHSRGKKFAFLLSLRVGVARLRLVSVIVVGALVAIAVAGTGLESASADPAPALTPLTYMSMGPSAYDAAGKLNVSSMAPVVYLVAYDVEEPSGGFVSYDFQVQYALDDAGHTLVTDERLPGLDAAPGYSWYYAAFDHDVLPGPGDYSWRMRPISKTGTDAAAWSDWQDFTGVNPPATPVGVAPGDDSVLQAGGILKVDVPGWSATDQGRVSFVVERDWENGNPTRVVDQAAPVDANGGSQITLPKLFDGKYRWFAILSKSGFQSEQSDYKTFTYAALPAPAGQPVMNQTPGFVSVQWPADRSTANLKSSTVTMSPGGYTATVQGRGPYSAAFEKVPPGNYVVSAHGTSPVGDGPATSINFTVQATAPVAVRDLTVDTTAANSAKVTWTPPDFDGGTSVDHYGLTVSSWDHPNFDSTTYETSDTSYDLTGLDPGYHFVVQVTAINSQGASDTAAAGFSVFGPPAAPTNVTVRPGDGFAYLNWDQAEDHGSPITEYKIAIDGDGHTTDVTAVDGPQGATIGGLDNDVAYTFHVTAVNAAGEGPAAESPSVTPKSQSTDTDGDGLPDVAELKVGSNPNLGDTDGDGLTDAEEVLKLAGLTNPALADSDANGIADPDDDSDSDGLANRTEIDLATDPAAPDSDGDGLKDGQEASLGTNPVQVDTDSDGLKDGFERQTGSNPLLADSDGDGNDDGASTAVVALAATSSSSGEDAGDDVGVTASVQATGLIAQGVHLSAYWGSSLPGMVSPVASITSQDDSTTGPAPAAARTSTSTITFTKFNAPVGNRLSDLKPVTFNDVSGTWELSDANVSVSTADETLTITAATTGLQYAVVDLNVWRANARQCDAAAAGQAPLDVQVILDSTSSMDSDTEGERFTALRTVLSSLRPTDRVFLQAPAILMDDVGVGEPTTSGLGSTANRHNWSDESAVGQTGVSPARAISAVNDLEADYVPTTPASPYWFGEYTGDDLYHSLLADPDIPIGEQLLGADQRSLDRVGSNPYVQDAPKFDCRENVTVLVTDGKMVPDLDPGQPDNSGKWNDYPAGYVPFVDRTDPVHVLDVGDGDADASWMAALAASTGGTYSYVPTTTDLASWTSAPTPTVDLSHSNTQIDSDGDGLSDYVETHGITNVMGEYGIGKTRYFTDPGNADTDGDGISDGDEAGTPATVEDLGEPLHSGTPETAYYVKSDPQSEDGDRDGVTDSDEIEAGSFALDADFDADGLNDGQEEVRGTQWDRFDSDSDGFWDGYEVEHTKDGYDPLSYDPPVDPLSWLHDFSIGLFCGDFEICRLNTIPWLAGSVASGLLVYGDVRDTIIDFAHGEPVSAFATLAGLIPAVGDAAGTVLRVGKFAARLSTDQRAVSAALRIVDKATGATTDILAVARKISADTVKGFEDLGLSPNRIARLFESTPLKRLKQILHDPDISIVDDYSTKIIDGKALEAPGEFSTGRAGELYLYKYLDKVGYRQKQFTVDAADGLPAEIRRPDCVTITDAGVVYFESKVGNVSGARVLNEIAKDKRLLAQNGDPDVIEWHFFANSQTGVIGMTEPMLNAMKDAGIKIFVHLPR